MQIKNIDSLNPEDYACYAVTNIKENFKIYTVHPSGLKEINHYDLYQIEDYILIAFTRMFIVKSEFIYRIVSESYSQDINAETFESLEDILLGDYDKDVHTFIIHNSVANISKEQHGEWLGSAIDPKRRCDILDDHYISMPFLDANKEGASDILDRNHLGNDNVIGWQLVLASMSNIYIAKLTHGIMTDRAYKEWPGRVFVSQTFPHILKMAYQWSTLAENPWNSNDTIAVKCKKAFEDWNIPADAIEELISYQPSTVLEHYFSAEEDPRQSISEPTDISPKFKKWFMSNIRYRTLSSLVENFPFPVSIPQSIIDKEVQFFESKIYDFIINNSLDPETTSSVDILNIVYNSSEYIDNKGKNNSVDDIVLKYFSRTEKELVKNYLNEIVEPMNFLDQASLEELE